MHEQKEGVFMRDSAYKKFLYSKMYVHFNAEMQIHFYMTKYLC